MPPDATAALAGTAPTADPVVEGPGAANPAARPEAGAAAHPGASAAADLERLAGDLGAVDDALRRLDDGTYGTCSGCGIVLDDAWLAADPTAARCRACGPAPAPPSPPAG